MPSSQCVHRALVGFGVTEMVLGLGILACGVVGKIEKSRLHEMYHGIWGGAIYIFIGLMVRTLIALLLFHLRSYSLNR
jgi:hypothetical protein